MPDRDVENPDLDLAERLSDLPQPHPASPHIWDELSVKLSSGSPPATPRPSARRKAAAKTSWRMRLVTVGVSVALLGLLASVVSRLGEGGGGDGSCAALVKWNGRVYRGNT